MQAVYYIYTSPVALLFIVDAVLLHPFQNSTLSPIYPDTTLSFPFSSLLVFHHLQQQLDLSTPCANRFSSSLSLLHACTLNIHKSKMYYKSSAESNSPSFASHTPPLAATIPLITSYTTDSQASCFPHPLQICVALRLLSLAHFPNDPLPSDIYSIVSASFLAFPHGYLSVGSAGSCDGWMGGDPCG